MNVHSENVDFSTYTPGEKDHKGRIISSVIGQQGNDFIIYITKDSPDIKYTCTEDYLPEDKILGLGEYDKLKRQIATTIPNKSKSSIEFELNKALLNFFKTKGDTTVFDNIASYIESTATESARAKYLLAGLVLLFPYVILIILMWPDILQNENSIIASGFAGGVGAFISMACKNKKKLDLNPFIEDKHIYFAGVIRIILGIIFGVVFFWGAESGYLLCNMPNKQILLFCFIVGFSERKIPEIFRKAEEQTLG